MSSLTVYSNDTPGNTIMPSHTPPAFSPPQPKRVMHGQVVKLLQAARKNRLSQGQDMPYMPYPCTSLAEACMHIRYNGFILIQSGRIDYTLGVFSLKTLGTGMGSRMGDMTIIQWYEVVALLKANYLIRKVIKSPTLTPDCSQPPKAGNKVLELVMQSPTVEAGVGLVAYCRLNTDIDTIPASKWEEVYLDPTGLEKFVGTTLMGDDTIHVFWSDQDEAFVAQRA